jgi:hypothetical protein
MMKRVTPKLNPKINPNEKAILEGLIARVCNCYEQGILIMPNRELAPLQTWQAKIPNFVGRGPKVKVVDINLTFTYLGTRPTAGRNEAVIDMVGLVTSREKNATKPMGKATGRAAFDLAGGYIAELKTRIASEHEVGANLRFVVAENVEHYRETGNKFNIVARAPKQSDPPGGPPPGGLPPGKANTFDGMAKGFDKPAKSAVPTSYLKIVSSPGDYIGQGKSYQYAGGELTVQKAPRGIRVTVGGMKVIWRLDIGAPKGQFLQVGEYRDAKRHAFSGTSPGLDFYGMGRGSNQLAGEFVVWELEVQGGQITRLAIDFVQRSEGKGPPLTGKLRFNSTLE